jgi:hypothetical protein
MLHIFFIMAMISRIYLFLLACLVRITAHSCPVLLLPDFLQPFSIKTDASSSGIAAKREAGRSLRKAGRYNAEKKEEWIERYRVKRHQRNFNNKITAIDRISPANARRWVKGRYARNDKPHAEADDEPRGVRQQLRVRLQQQWTQQRQHRHRSKNNGDACTLALFPNEMLSTWFVRIG